VAKLMKKFVMLHLTLYGMLLCFLTGCGLSPAYLMASGLTIDKNEIVRSFPELTDRPDILQVAEETGKSLGYKSHGFYSTGYFNCLTLSGLSDSLVKQALLPGGTETEIRFTRPKPKPMADFKERIKMAEAAGEKVPERTIQKMTTLCISMKHKGYWGAGGKQEAERVLNEFVDKFLERARVQK
jgi:hypothetical protein